MVILASGSPRRKELLSLVTEDYKIVPADIDETLSEDIENIEKFPEDLAMQKAEFVAQNGHQNDIVIGCDTAVFVDGEMLGKPKDEHSAKEMLKKLSGKAHKVITGCCIVNGKRKACFSETTLVEFYPLSDEEIDEYIATKEPFDKAGAYGIQGKGALLVKGIAGDYYNVVGMPISKLKRELIKLV